MAASGLNSDVCFDEELAEIELSHLKEKLKALGWPTIATFAFSSAYVPGSNDDVFQTEVIAKILPDGSPPPQDVARLRRLLFECYAATTSDMRGRREFSNGFQ